MRVVSVTDRPRLPLEDCEIAWSMMALFGRRPRRDDGAVAEACWLVVFVVLVACGPFVR